MSEPPPSQPSADAPASDEPAPPREAAVDAPGGPALIEEQPSAAPAVEAAAPAVEAAAPAVEAAAPAVGAAAPAVEAAAPAVEAAAPAKHTPWVTYALIAANSAVWLVMIAAGASGLSPSAQWLFEHGGNLGAVTLEGEEWRLFTSMFVHAGVLHLVMNMFGLVGGGKLVERLFGRLGFAAIYLVSGLAGSLATALRPGVVSVGASGAIFGVLGALGAYYALHRGRMEQTTAKEASGLLVFIGYNLLYGFTATGIDMYAHLGGLAAGFLCGLALQLGPGGGTLRRTVAVGALGLAAVIAGAFLAPTRVGADQRAIQAFAAVEEKAIARWRELVDQARAGAMTDEQVAGAIEQDILPAWRAARGAFEQSSAGGPKRAILLEYMGVRQDGWEKIAQAIRTGDDAAAERGVARLQEADAIAKKLLE